MKPEQKAIRLSAAVLVGAIVLRLLSGLPDGSWPVRLSQALIFLQTGRFITQDISVMAEQPTQTTCTTTTSEISRPPAIVFTPEDAAAVQLRNSSGCDVDITQLLLQPLDWNLTENGPSVLILHTHGTESYADTQDFRSKDESENMIAVGEQLKTRLENAGIGVIHDRTMHDAESYNGSYAHARTSVSQYLQQYPSIRLVLDLHRDSAEDAEGNQIDYTVATAQGDAAKLMLVMGTDAGGLEYPNWRSNLSLAVKLHAQLEMLCGSICRPMYLRTSRFNQDLHPGMLLVEVGAAGNTRQEALLAADILAQGLIALAYGANV